MEKDIILYAVSKMSARVAKSIQTLKVFNFDKSTLVPKELDPTLWMDPAGNINEPRRDLLKSIQQSKVQSFSH